jgi:predicted enzyme related to lactoylglutathione lyase
VKYVLEHIPAGCKLATETKQEVTRMANPFVHVELNTTDLAQAKSFYSGLFNWTLSDVPMGPGQSYTMIEVGEGTGGGMMTHPVPGAPSAWLAYVGVDDIQAATDKARSLGAKVMREPMEVMGSGWLSIIIDPTGAALGLWQANAK